MRKLHFLIFCLVISSATYSQCKNSIQLKKATNESSLGKGGAIELSVSTTDSFTCVLSIEKGSGPQVIDERKGEGSQVIRFEKLDIDNTYMIQVEFLSDKNSPCRRLQKSGIIIEAE